MTKKTMTVEEMERRWPECPPNKAVTVDFQFIEKDENGIRRREIEFMINQDTIQEVRDYLDAVEECLNG